MLLVHPASAGHGLNLQDGGPTYDLELWEQLTGRLYRQGQKETVTVICLVAEGTVDEDAMRCLEVKGNGQAAMMEAVKARIKKYTSA